MLRAQGITKMPKSGVWTVTVPGAVAGWVALQQKFGAKPLSELLAPAIYYVENGVPINEVTAEDWRDFEKVLAEHPYSKATFLVNGERAPRFGEAWKKPDLARSLRRIAGNGADGFYKGSTAQAIVDTLHEFGGVMTLDDLAAFKPEWVEPISTTHRGWSVYELPPNTQGIVALMMLNLMEQFPMTDYGFHPSKSLHTMIEAKKLTYADMLKYVGDPQSSPPQPNRTNDTVTHDWMVIDRENSDWRNGGVHDWSPLPSSVRSRPNFRDSQERLRPLA